MQDALLLLRGCASNLIAYLQCCYMEWSPVLPRVLWYSTKWCMKYGVDDGVCVCMCGACVVYVWRMCVCVYVYCICIVYV